MQIWCNDSKEQRSNGRTRRGGFTSYLSDNPLHISSTIKDMSEEGFEKAAEKMHAQIDAYMLQGFQALDVTEYLDRYNIDQSSMDGMNRFLSALAVVDETLKATEELRNPTSEWVTQAEAAVAQMKAWEEVMQSTGVEEVSFLLRSRENWKTTSNLGASLIGLEYGLTGRTARPSGKHMVAPYFAEWMMGVPAGWTNPEGSRLDGE